MASADELTDGRPVETRNPLVPMEVAHDGGEAAGAGGAAGGGGDPAEANLRMGLSRKRLIAVTVGGVLVLCAAAAALAVFLVYYNPVQLTKLAVPQKLYVTFTAVGRKQFNSSSVVGNVYIPDTSSLSSGGMYATSAYIGNFDTSYLYPPIYEKRFLSPLVHAASPLVGAAASPLIGDAYTIPVTPTRPNATIVSFVDGRAYYASYARFDANVAPDPTVGCADDYSIPPLTELVTALQGASHVPLSDVDQSMLSPECDTTLPIWLARYQGGSYLMCQAIGDKNHYKVMGEEFIADVAVNTPGAPVPAAPQPPAGLSCPEVKFPTATQRRLRADEVDMDEDSWWSLSAAAQAAARRRLAPARRCLFMHGMGPKTDDAPTSTYTSYWGDAHTHVFLHRNTIGRSWDDESLQNYFCSQAAVNGVISNTNLFTHSMGSLIVAGALASGKCRMDASTKWMHVQGPLLGTKAADFASNLCKNGPGVVVSLANSMGFCVGNNPAAAVNSLRRGYSGRQTFSQLVSYVRNNVDAAMCGRATLGLDKIVGLALSALHDFVGYGEDSDGLVPWSSCASNMPAGFKDKYDTSFMDAGVHHLDGTCRNGDGWFGSNRKPCKWYEWVTRT